MIECTVTVIPTVIAAEGGRIDLHGERFSDPFPSGVECTAFAFRATGGSVDPAVRASSAVSRSACMLR